MRRPDKTEELLRYTFSADEKAELSQKLALACQNKARAEDEKKEAMAGFKGQIDREGANMNHFSRLVNNGWEMRPTQCIIEYNEPVMGTKRIVRIDTGEIVREIAMTASEYQDTIVFVDPAADEKLAEKMRLEKMEQAVRDFFNKPSEPSPEPIELADITAFKSGEYIIAAADEAAAKAYVEEHALVLTDELVWVAPDETTFGGFEALYGDEARTARAAIMRMFELGKTFPTLLAFPAGIAPDAEAEANGEEPPADGKKKAKRKPKGDTTAE